MNNDLIFVTTGTQFPFDRLVVQIDKWAGEQKGIKVVAQTAKSEKNFKNITTVDFLSPKQYLDYVERARVIIGHAGMGTIITGFEKKKPLILMARKLEFGEHRNDHQQSTVDKFVDTKGIYIANNPTQLFKLLNDFRNLDYAKESNTRNRDSLIDFISQEIKGK